MNKYTIIPSSLQYISAPAVDQEINVNLEGASRELVEYDRTTTVSLAQVYDDERQACTIYRPTFNISYFYANTLTGTTDYTPFVNSLYYVSPEESKASGVWKGFPQYFEFDFFRPDVKDQHFDYKSKSGYSYNWSFYMTYPAQNDATKKLSFSSRQSGNIDWVAGDGIAFSMLNATFNGAPVIRFICAAPHGLSVGEYAELSFSYKSSNLFQVFNLGNGQTGSEEYIFNILNLSFTGNTFSNNKTGTFKRVINPDNLTETRSSYYVRQHKVLSTPSDLIVTKNGFQKNLFNEEKKFEYSSITPNNISRISQKTSSNSYNVTTARDIDLFGLLDNQKRPIDAIYLTIINKGYSGYFNYPFAGSGLKQGWKFNISSTSRTWWDGNNVNSNVNTPTGSYTLTNGATKTFYYNEDLNVGDIIDGDFCEWNNYEQAERVISPYYQKIKYNPYVFQTTDLMDTNAPGFYYEPHLKMNIRFFSNYIETANPTGVDNIPGYSFYSRADREFRWRDLYTIGFIDETGRGVDYPYLNSSHYPHNNVIFRLIPEGINFTENDGIGYSVKPLIDGCE